MNPKRLSIALVMLGMCGCSAVRRHASEPGETKVDLDQTPAAVRQTIERELVGAQLEDIARKERPSGIIYETDIIRDGHKWEVVVGEDGKVIFRIQEGSAPKTKSVNPESAKSTAYGWRETFEVNKTNLSPTGTNPYLPIQPGTVLKLVHRNDRLTVSILPYTQTVDGVTTGVLEEREEKDGQ